MQTSYPDTAPGARTPTTDTVDGVSAGDARTPRRLADTLRYIPPVSALGTAFVLQTIAMTDTVGSALAPKYGHLAWVGAALLGVSVASCAEGGAAYLMDLYDKHLLAGDSVWVLRLTMLAYVTASAGVIHWWTDHRGLPQVISWVLAGMSASALYLWSRGARWRRRDVMRRKGLIDEAMPRFALAARLFHPVRWFNTVRLISWEPVRSTDEARAVYTAWRTAKKARRHGQPDTTDTVEQTIRPDSPPPPDRVRPDTIRPAVPDAAADQTDTPTNVRPLSAATGRRRAVAGQATIAQLADTLAREHPGQRVGRPTAEATLKRVYGSCSKERTIAAKDLHNARLGGDVAADDEERERVAAV